MTAAASLVACSTAPAPAPHEGVPIDSVALAATPSVASSAPVTSASAAVPADPATRCQGGDAAACLAHANVCRPDFAGPPRWDSSDCAERERKACDTGAWDECYSLAQRYRDGQGVAVDEAQTSTLLVVACEHGSDPMACIELAYRYDGGIGIPKDAKKAVATFVGVCDEESGIFPQPCQTLAAHLAAGDGVAKDEARAARIHAATCSQGVCDFDAIAALCSELSPSAKTTAGCASAGVALGLMVAGAPEANPTKARALLERACKRKEAEGCRELADWYTRGRFWPKTKIEPDEDKAAGFRAQACAAGDRASCAP